MRKNQKLECLYDYDFIVLAINSHSKAYKLCWSINKRMGLNFELTNSHKTNGGLFFKRYKSAITNGRTLNLLENRSKNGYLIPSKKQINYFLIIDKDSWFIEKEGFLNAEIVNKIWMEHLSGKRDWSFRVWSIVIFQQWLESQNLD